MTEYSYQLRPSPAAARQTLPPSRRRVAPSVGGNDGVKVEIVIKDDDGAR